MQKSEPDTSRPPRQELSHRMLVDGDDTAGTCSLVLWILPPFWAENRMHQHRTHAEGCYVLAGVLAVTVGEQTHVLHVGQSAFAPRRTPHRLWNPTAEATTVLLIATPGCTEDALFAQEEPSPPPIEPAPA
jgi:quercetin dioxygenase-like cupin family protein